jgi:hypothetical protein
MPLVRRIVVAAISFQLLFYLGCGPSGPEIARVKGTVTMDGQPLSNATVVFIPPNGRPSAARTNQEGNYVLNFSGGRKGAIPGLNRIRITTLADPSVDEEGNSIPGQKETIPMRYNQMSELEFDVEDGKENTANFDLESGGKVINEAY